MSYKIVEEFFHSDICSDPDNQNKAKVCVFVGLDAQGNRMYDLHERRVRNGNLNTLLGPTHPFFSLAQRRRSPCTTHLTLKLLSPAIRKKREKKA